MERDEQVVEQHEVVQERVELQDAELDPDAQELPCPLVEQELAVQ